VLKEWDAPEQKTTSPRSGPAPSNDLPANSALRIVAIDKRLGSRGQPDRQPAGSPSSRPPFSSQSQSETKQRAEARKTLGELVARQRAASPPPPNSKAGLPSFGRTALERGVGQQTDIRA
jgi:hypothetical protein